MRFNRAFPAAFLLLAAAGCDNVLSTSPESSIPADQIIVDSKSALGALTGAYDGLQSLSYYGLDIQLLGDLPADNSTWVGTYQFLGDIENNQIAADNPEVTDMWEAIYEQIDRDNVILSRVPEVAAIDDDTKKEVMGEAYFLRALGYSNLVKFWGAVPMPLAPVQSADDAAKYTRTPVPDVYTQILSDLDNAAAMISNTSNTRRATPMAVEALRARVLFYRASVAGANAQADYQAALAAANSVLAGRDTLTVPFGNLFTATGTDTDEDIFRVSFTPAEYNELGYYWLTPDAPRCAPRRSWHRRSRRTTFASPIRSARARRAAASSRRPSGRPRWAPSIRTSSAWRRSCSSRPKRWPALAGWQKRWTSTTRSAFGPGSPSMCSVSTSRPRPTCSRRSCSSADMSSRSKVIAGRISSGPGSPER